MSVIAIADPFAAPHGQIIERLEPFCDGNLERFSDHELLDAYDIATSWAGELPAASTALNQIAVEWYGRYRRNLPSTGSDPEAGQFADLDGLFAPFDRFDDRLCLHRARHASL